MGGDPRTTDLLFQTVRSAANNDVAGYKATLGQIRDRHLGLAESILPPADAERIREAINKDIGQIQDVLRAVSLMRVEFAELLELVSGYGELWSALILNELLSSSGMDFVFLDARRVLRVDSEQSEGGPAILWQESASLLGTYLSDLRRERPGAHLVVTGYIATNRDGGATTLKRDGSDFTATIFGRLLRATEVVIWTDVDGILTADPRRVPECQVLPEVSYSEATELAYFGAKIIPPKAMAPAMEHRIPMYIRNTFRPEGKGSRIFETCDLTLRRNSCVAGFSTVEDVALVNVEGTGLMRASSIAESIFKAMQSSRISIKLLTQASSEHSICFATARDEAAQAKAILEDAFAQDLARGTISAVTVIDDCTILAAVGDGMAQTPGVAGRFFSAVARANINVVAIAQGCDERNISTVIKRADTERALRAVHSAFLLSEVTVSVGIICGEGGRLGDPNSHIGTALLQTLLERRDWLQAR